MILQVSPQGTMPPKVILIWDYDSAIGQVNSSYPYNFHEETLLTEIRNVDRILELGREFQIRMTFAVVGFAAEEGQFPYHVPGQIQAIAAAGHEVASHSWRHEWFPFLQKEQIRRSLRRSKEALERRLGSPGAVTGFVPPFSRPMSWYGRLALSAGDRAFGPAFAGANLGSLLPLVREAGYRWCRVLYRPVWAKLTGRGVQPERLFWHDGVACVPQHVCGFGEATVRLLDESLRHGRDLVVTGHPLGLSLPHEENLSKLVHFLQHVSSLQEKGVVQSATVSEMLA